MRCHYEVMEVPMNVNAEDLKKKYRQLALQYHPDKNRDNVDEATEKFREIQQAYEVLSDIQERAWYDRNRDAILRKDLAKEFQERNVDVFPYFRTSCYSGYNDSPKGFYTVYRDIFEKIAAEDLDFMDKDDSDYEIPGFGKSDSPYKEVVHEFYAFWEAYCTAKTYDWVVEFDARSAPNRRVQRLIEKENKKARDQARKTRNEEIRNLVAFVRKRDKRIQAYRVMLQEKAAENALKMEATRLKQLEERKRETLDYKEAQWSSMASLESELKLLEKNVSQNFGDSNIYLEDDEEEESSDEDVADSYYCVACEKYFRTEKAFGNHEKSKKHKDNVVILKSTMQEEDKNFFLVDGDDDNKESELENPDANNSPVHSIEADDKDVDSLDENSSIVEKSKKKQKKKKKNNRLPSPDTSETEIHTSDVPTTTDELPDTSETSTSAPSEPQQQSQVKLKGKKAKDAKRKAKLESGVTVTPEVKEPEECLAYCDACGNRFTTRNKLFDHLKKTGHATIKNGPKQSSKKADKKKGKG